MADNKKRILLVDDSSEDIHFLMETLKRDYAVVVATSGDKALGLAVKDPAPDVILMDVVMPGKDGYETCRLLKKNNVTRDIDVIFVSAHDTIQEKLAGYEAGGSDYVIKPVQPDELLQKVRVSLDNRRIRRETRAERAEKEAAFSTAMTAMTSAGEQGIVLGFLRNSFNVATTQELAQSIVTAVANYALENSVQIRSPRGVVNAGTREPVPPLEMELLSRLSDRERIMEHENRLIANFGRVSLLVKNMPLHADRRGRIRDHLAILLEGADARQSLIEMNQAEERRREALQRIIHDSRQMLEEVQRAQKAHKERSVGLMDEMLKNIERSFSSWGLTDAQESVLLGIVQEGVNKSLSHFEEGLKVDDRFENILQDVISFSS